MAGAGGEQPEPGDFAPSSSGGVRTVRQVVAVTLTGVRLCPLVSWSARGSDTDRPGYEVTWSVVPGDVLARPDDDADRSFVALGGHEAVADLVAPVRAEDARTLVCDHDRHDAYVRAWDVGSGCVVRCAGCHVVLEQWRLDGIAGGIPDPQTYLV